MWKKPTCGGYDLIFRVLSAFLVTLCLVIISWRIRKFAGISPLRSPASLERSFHRDSNYGNASETSSAHKDLSLPEERGGDEIFEPDEQNVFGRRRSRHQKDDFSANETNNLAAEGPPNAVMAAGADNDGLPPAKPASLPGGKKKHKKGKKRPSAYSIRRRQRLRMKALNQSSDVKLVPLDDDPLFDLPLAEALSNFFNEKTVMELGAGAGQYSKIIAKKAKKVTGYDGNMDAVRLSGGLVKHADLTQSQRLEVHDWVLSIEAGSKLIPEFLLAFIDNIHRHNREGVVLSWGIYDDKRLILSNGEGNHYVKKLLASINYVRDENAERDLRNFASTEWFKASLMVFRKLKEGKISSRYQFSNEITRHGPNPPKITSRAPNSKNIARDAPISAEITPEPQFGKKIHFHSPIG